MPTVLITGCSSGIGRALADAFRDAGHTVWATARKAEDVEVLSAAGFTARQLDVNDSEALARLAEEPRNPRHPGQQRRLRRHGPVARRWRGRPAPAVRNQRVRRGGRNPRAVPVATPLTRNSGEHRQCFRCAGHTVRRCLLRLESRCTCLERCFAPGAWRRSVCR